jgi:hypothetical protein
MVVTQGGSSSSEGFEVKAFTFFDEAHILLSREESLLSRCLDSASRTAHDLGRLRINLASSFSDFGPSSKISTTGLSSRNQGRLRWIMCAYMHRAISINAFGIFSVGHSKPNRGMHLPNPAFIIAYLQTVDLDLERVFHFTCRNGSEAEA